MYAMPANRAMVAERQGRLARGLAVGRRRASSRRPAVSTVRVPLGRAMVGCTRTDTVSGRCGDAKSSVNIFVAEKLRILPEERHLF